MKQTVLAVLLGANVLGATLAHAATSASEATSAAPAAVVDTAFVAAAAQRGAIIGDVRSADDYKKGHIPGAVNVGDIGKVLRYESDEDYIPLDQIG